MLLSSTLILKILQAPMLQTVFGHAKGSELHLTCISSQLVLSCLGHSVVETSDSARNSPSNCTNLTAEMHQQQLKNDYHSFKQLQFLLCILTYCAWMYLEIIQWHQKATSVLFEICTLLVRKYNNYLKLFKKKQTHSSQTTCFCFREMKSWKCDCFYILEVTPPKM
jgi:hypothetical protein